MLSEHKIGITGSVIICCALLFLSCTKNDSTSPSTTTLSQFASSLAEELVLASPTAQSSATLLGFSASSNPHTMSTPAADQNASTKQDALETLLAATAPASCNIDITISAAGRANCYGPSVQYTNHEFDNSNGSWPGGDLGIWEESSNGEACIAAQLTAQMKGAISLVDMAQFITAGMACTANKNSLTLPAENASLDLTSYIGSSVTLNGTALTVSTATMAREANDASGNPVYVTSLTGTAGTTTVTIRLKHVSTAANDSTSKGKISVKYSTSSSTDGVSLEYDKVSSTSAKMLLKKINFNGNSADPFVSASNLTVDYSKAWNNNADYLLAEFNPTDYSGTFAYAWQAGHGDSHTRTFNAKITNDAGTISGSAFFGFGPTMQTGAGAISGMICAWTGPDQTHTPVSEVQRQNISFSGSKFVVSGTSYTIFDPVADCEASGTMAMSWNSGANTRTVNSTTKNLVPLSEISTVIGTLPTAPTNVDL